MEVFKKWSSIENYYQKPIFEKWLRMYPELNTEVFEVTEKIHGANFSLIAEPNKKVVFAKRPSILNNDKNFYDYEDTFLKPGYVELVEFLEILAEETGNIYQLYGELFGAKIQKGVFYGNEIQFRWYALRENGTVLTPKETEKIMKLFMYLKVPVIGQFSACGDFLNFLDKFDTKFQSKLTPENYESDNICEGVVIAPYEKQYYNQKSLLLIKKKNEEFKDKANKPKRVRVEKKLPEKVSNLVNEALLYINENRTNDLFSKIGRLESMRDAGKFAKEYFNDMFADFEKDNYTEWNNLEKADQKIIKKQIGSAIFKELQNSLSR